MKGSTLTEHTIFFILRLRHPNRLLLGSLVNCPFRTWTVDVLCPLSCNSQQTSAPDLLPPHWSKVQWSNRTFQERNTNAKAIQKASLADTEKHPSLWTLSKHIWHDDTVMWQAATDQLQPTAFWSADWTSKNMRGRAGGYRQVDFF